MFGIRSIPTCVLLMGTASRWTASWARCPRARCATFLDKHVPSEGELEAEADAEDAQALICRWRPHAALPTGEALAADPGNDDARYDYVAC
jgi:putative thioredoxin